MRRLSDMERVFWNSLSVPCHSPKVRRMNLRPECCTLASDARKLWIAFADLIELQIAPEGALSPVKGIANKLPEHAARLAAVLALVSDAGHQ